MQALGRSFMANAAAAQGLSSALAPPTPANSGRNGLTESLRNSGVGAGGVGGAGGSSSSPRNNASQHTVSVSLGKAWLEVLVKLMRRAGGIGGGRSGRDSSTGGAGVVTAALEDPATRDSLLVLFERTAAGVAAAAAAAIAVSSSPSIEERGGDGGGGDSGGGRGKMPSWADPALVLRSFVLLREVLMRVPDAYVVPLRRRGVLHR